MALAPWQVGLLAVEGHSGAALPNALDPAVGKAVTDVGGEHAVLGKAHGINLKQGNTGFIFVQHWCGF